MPLRDGFEEARLALAVLDDGISTPERIATGN
jgi:hypothetical protein